MTVATETAVGPAVLQDSEPDYLRVIGDTYDQLQRRWRFVEPYAPLGAPRNACILEWWDLDDPDESSIFNIHDPDMPPGSRNISQPDREEVEAALGRELPRWDWFYAFASARLRKALPAMLGTGLGLIRNAVHRGNKARALLGLDPAPTIEESRVMQLQAARSSLPEFPEGARAYLVEPWASDLEYYAGDPLKIGVEPGAVIVFTPDAPDVSAPGWAAERIDADTLSRLRRSFLDHDTTGPREMWRYMASRLTPLTHEWHPGYVDPLAEFLADHRHFRRKVLPVLVLRKGGDHG